MLNNRKCILNSHDFKNEIKVSDYIWNYLHKITGSKHVFLLSGGGMMHLLDSVGKSKFKVIPMHHEQAASIAAMLMEEPKIL